MSAAWNKKFTEIPKNTPSRLISKTEQLLLLEWITVHWLISWMQSHINLAVVILDINVSI